MLLDIADMRKNYVRRTLTEAETPGDPFTLFGQWFKEAVDAGQTEPNAMTLATATPDGRPAARIVLLKGFDESGFSFYTNYESRKGEDLAGNPACALLFAWLELERQVRIEGRAERLPAEVSEAYFQSRPKGSQIGAWASPQSRVIVGREGLEEKVQALTAQYADAEQLPLPPFWGGYLVRPERIEFWQGRESRLHDRILYAREGDDWRIERLAP